MTALEACARKLWIVSSTVCQAQRNGAKVAADDILALANLTGVRNPKICSLAFATLALVGADADNIEPFPPQPPAATA